MSKVCRLCSVAIRVGYSLLSEPISNLLVSIPDIKVEKNASASTICCCKCLYKLRLIHSYNQDFLRADILLRDNFITYDGERKPIRILKSLSLHMTKSDRCIICASKLDGKNDYLHFKRHFDVVQKCEYCSVVCDNIHAYRLHQVRFHNETSCEYRCADCKARFRYATFYYQHNQSFHVPPALSEVTVSREGTYRRCTKILSCKECSKVFTNKKLLYMHTKCHKLLECFICFKTITAPNMKKHMLLHEDKATICKICGATAKNSESMRSHMWYTHSNRAYICKYCNKEFKRKNFLDLHMLNHSGNFRHCCDKCGKIFRMAAMLNKHVKQVHLKHKPHKCDQCDASFRRKSELQNHMEKHVGLLKPYECEICKKICKDGRCLLAHYKYTHKFEEEKTFPCQYCEKKFTKLSGVALHETRKHADIQLRVITDENSPHG